MLILSSDKNLVQAGKKLSNSRTSFRVEFVGDRHLARFTKLKDALFGEGNINFPALGAFFFMMPFMLVHFHALAAGAKGSCEGKSAVYNF